MKSQMILTIAVLAAVCVSSAAFSKTTEKVVTEKASAEKVKKETYEAVDAAGAYAGEKKEEFAARMKSNLNELDREIADLKKESAAKSDEVRVATKQKIQDLQKKRDDLNARYEAFEKSSGRAWTRMKSGMEKAWGDVRAADSDAKTELETKK